MKATDISGWDSSTEFDEVGTDRHRVEALEKVTGAARYAADTQLPGLLHVAVVRSPHPHARVEAVDTTAALATDGVVSVLTADDTDDIIWYDEATPLFSDVVRFVGDEVAAVAATSMEAARRGVRAVDVRYSPLPHVTEPEAALDEHAPRIHTDGNQAGDAQITERGDIDAAFADATIVVEGEYRTPIAVHNALEPHGCTAWWTDRTLTVHSSTQGVNAVREMLADRLGLDQNQVRVVAEHVGGGFGAKQVAWKNTAIAALVSRKSGRPVRLMLDRRAENLGAGKRNATIQRVRLGADADGHLCAIDADLIADVGAYGVAGEPSMVDGSYLHLYACENVRTVSRRARTNTGPAVAFRAPGYVEGAFALESAMDELARRLDIDPIELRRRNYTERDQVDDLPLSSPDALRRCYDRVSEVSGWSGSSPSGAVTDGPPADGLARGRGFAAHEWAAGKANPPGYAWIELNQDGTAHVVTSAQDIGTGTRTALTQIAAESLGLDPRRIRMTLGDTAAGPAAPTSAGSATMPTMAPAIRAAALDAVHQVLARAAQHLHVPAERLVMDDGTVRDETGDASIALDELLENLDPVAIHGRGGRVDPPEDVSVRTFGAAVADVVVDTATGEIRVEHLVVAPDCGRIVNPLLVESQVIGGATQGIGYALTEEQVFDHRLGMAVNADLEEYLVPTIGDVPPIEHAAVDLPDLAANPLGVKGIGEQPLIAVPAAIANAVHDAIGVRFRELPLTRRRVLDALAPTPPDARTRPDDPQEGPR